MPSRTESWGDRQAVIRRILAAGVIRNQTELLNRLQDSGFHVTQSSVSRDLQELGAVKIGGRYVTREALTRGAPPAGGLEEIAPSLRTAGAAGPNILVVTTLPGRAQTVAFTIDEAGWPEVVGTVAGDDTLFIATAGRREQAKVAARLGALMKEAPGA